MKKLIFLLVFFALLFPSVWLSDLSSGSTPTPTPSTPITQYLVYNLSGQLVVASNQIPAHIPFDCTIGDISVAVFTAPTDADILIAIDINGSSLFGVGTNIGITSTLKTNTRAPFTTNGSMFDELTFHILQVGSTISGSDLSIIIPVVAR